MATLYDHNGRKVELKLLQDELAAPSLTGIRTLWNETVASGLTPGRLTTLLRAAADGDPLEYLTLAEEMEERDAHYASVLGTRKRALSGLEVQVEATSDAAREVEQADAVRALTAAPAFCFLVEDLLDSLGKGFSVVELVWQRSATRWQPRFEHRDPRWFRFDRTTGREVRLLDERNALEGVELPPYKFVVHTHRLKSGVPIRGGLAFLACWAYLFKAYTVKDWMAFLETFGMPVRVGKYGDRASKDDIAVLVRAVANIGTDAGAVLPESMQIEFPEAGGKQGSVNVYDTMAQWLDRQVSKAVLGQTMTSDDGASLAQAKVHNDVRIDILKADARQVAATLNRDLVRPFIDLNFGPPADGLYPVLTLPVPEPEDIAGLVAALKELVPLGLKVEASVIRDKLGLPDPEEGAELLGVVVAPAQGPGPALNRAVNQEHTDGQGPARTGTDEQDTPDALVARLEAETAPEIAGMVETIRQWAEEADSLQALRDRLLAAYGDLPAPSLAGVMGTAFAAAAAAGIYAEAVESGATDAA